MMNLRNDRATEAPQPRRSEAQVFDSTYFNASLRANLDELRSKLYNGSAPPVPEHGSWMMADHAAPDAWTFAHTKASTSASSHQQGGHATAGGAPHLWVPESKQDKQRWLEKVYGGAQPVLAQQHILHPTTRSTHVRPASAAPSMTCSSRPRASSTCPHGEKRQRPLSMWPSRTNQGGEAGQGKARKRPQSAATSSSSSSSWGATVDDVSLRVQNSDGSKRETAATVIGNGNASAGVEHGRRRPMSAAAALRGGVDEVVRFEGGADSKSSNRRRRPMSASVGGGHQRGGLSGSGVPQRERPMTAGEGRKKAYRQLQDAWASTYDPLDAADTRGKRPSSVPRLSMLPSGGNVGYSFSDDDDDDDVLVIDEDDEEGWDDFEDEKEEQEEQDGWGDQNVGVVLSPAKPVKNVNVTNKIGSIGGGADAAREEYVPVPSGKAKGSRRITFDDSGRAVGGGHAVVPPSSPLSSRPISAPSALRKPPVIRLTATGSLGQSSSSARPSSAGPSLRLCSAIGGDQHHQHAACRGLDDDDAVLARRRARGEDVKVFVVNGPFQDVRRGLERRGWVENKSKRGATFDLRWTLHDSEVGYASLKRGQMVNHFEGNHEITTKGALCRTMRGMAWTLDRDHSSCVPASFDVSDPSEWDAFVEAFRDSAVTSVLLLFRGRAYNGSGAAFTGNKAVAALRACVRHAKGKAETLEGSGGGWEEWMLDTEADTVMALLGSAREKMRVHAAGGDGTVAFRNEESALRMGIVSAGVVGEEEEKLDREVEEAVQALARTDPQFRLAGECNVWISKAGNSSKGVGIKLFDRMSQVQDARGTGRVLQKYCESPLLVQGGRKFDLRIWVLVTEWDPLSIWIYDDCMVRLCSETFDLGDTTDLRRHLTNVSVNKDAASAESCVWDAAQLEAYLYQVTGDSEVWRHKLLPQVRQIIVDTLRCAVGEIRARKGSFELYGFDIMVDAGLRPWLLEANLSPDMRHTTPLKKRIGPRMVEGLLSLVVDVGLDRLAQAPVSGTEATSEEQRALMGAAMGDSSTRCVRRTGDAAGEACKCSACGGSGRWCLVYRAAEILGDHLGNGGGDLSLAVEGKRLDCKEWRRREAKMEGGRRDAAARLIQRLASTFLMSRRLLRMRAASVLLQASIRMSSCRVRQCAAKLLATSLLSSSRRIAPFAGAVLERARQRVGLAILMTAARRQWRFWISAVVIQRGWRGHSARGERRRRSEAAKLLTAWARGRGVGSWVWAVVRYADYEHDDLLEEWGAGGGGAVRMGVPFAWLSLSVGDVEGGKGRAGIGAGTKEGFRRVCLCAFRKHREGDAAARTLQRVTGTFLRRVRCRRDAAARTLQRMARGWAARVGLDRERRGACTLQGWARGTLARMEQSRMRLAAEVVMAAAERGRERRAYGRMIGARAVMVRVLREAVVRKVERHEAESCRARGAIACMIKRRVPRREWVEVVDAGRKLCGVAAAKAAARVFERRKVAAGVLGRAWRIYDARREAEGRRWGGEAGEDDEEEEEEEEDKVGRGGGGREEIVDGKGTRDDNAAVLDAGTSPSSSPSSSSKTTTTTTTKTTTTTTVATTASASQSETPPEDGPPPTVDGEPHCTVISKGALPAEAVNNTPVSPDKAVKADFDVAIQDVSLPDSQPLIHTAGVRVGKRGDEGTRKRRGEEREGRFRRLVLGIDDGADGTGQGQAVSKVMSPDVEGQVSSPASSSGSPQDVEGGGLVRKLARAASFGRLTQRGMEEGAAGEGGGRASARGLRPVVAPAVATVGSVVPHGGKTGIGGGLGGGCNIRPEPESAKERGGGRGGGGGGGSEGVAEKSEAKDRPWSARAVPLSERLVGGGVSSRSDGTAGNSSHSGRSTSRSNASFVAAHGAVGGIRRRAQDLGGAGGGNVSALRRKLSGSLRAGLDDEERAKARKRLGIDGSGGLFGGVDGGIEGSASHVKPSKREGVMVRAGMGREGGIQRKEREREGRIKEKTERQSVELWTDIGGMWGGRGEGAALVPSLSVSPLSSPLSSPGHGSICSGASDQIPTTVLDFGPEQGGAGVSKPVIMPRRKKFGGGDAAREANEVSGGGLGCKGGGKKPGPRLARDLENLVSVEPKVSPYVQQVMSSRVKLGGKGGRK